jgi:cell division protein FtsZ
MSLFEVDEATGIIHEAAGEDANVILGAVVDQEMDDDLMVTVIATGFNRRGHPAPRAPREVKKVERIPAGPDDLARFDVPAYERRGVELKFPAHRQDTGAEGKEKIDKSDPDKPAFLRKIMD